MNGHDDHSNLLVSLSFSRFTKILSVGTFHPEVPEAGVPIPSGSQMAFPPFSHAAPFLMCLVCRRVLAQEVDSLVPLPKKQGFYHKSGVSAPQREE